MKGISLSITSILLLLMCCCTEKPDEGRKKLKYLRSIVEAPGYVIIEKYEVEYIFQSRFDTIAKFSCESVFCDKCNNDNAKMIMDEYFINLDNIGVSFKGVCTACRDTLLSTYSFHDRLDRVKIVLENKRNR